MRSQTVNQYVILKNDVTNSFSFLKHVELRHGLVFVERSPIGDLPFARKEGRTGGKGKVYRIISIVF